MSPVLAKCGVPSGRERRPCSRPPGHAGEHRARRRERAPKKTVSRKSITRAELRVGGVLNPPVDLARPKTRADCTHGNNCLRPCPWVACKHHLYLDISPETGSITINFPDLEPWELRETCALDVAERGGITLEEVGDVLNLTRERIRQLEVRALFMLKRNRAIAEAA